MKRLLRHRSAQFFMVIMAAIAFLANSGNPPNGRTGAPFDNHCNGCHGGSNPNAYDGTIEVDGLPATVVPGTTYPLTVRMTSVAGNPVRGGFQLVVVDGANADYGDLTSPNTQTGTETFGTREYIDHRNPKNFSGTGSEITWSINWKAEGTPSGNVAKFYFIGNFCNGSGDAGDFMKTENLSVPVEAPANIDVAITATTDVACFGGNTGSATALASGGTGTYTYLWSNNATTPTINNLAAGTYTVTATASGGGTGTAVAVITQPSSALNVTAFSSNNLSCNNPTADITANITGGTPGYTLVWSGGSNDNPLTVTTAGTYTVTVFDNNGCTKTAVATVTSNTATPVAAAQGAIQSCTAGTATVTGTGSSTGANITYSWSALGSGIVLAGANSLNATVSGADVYVLVVTNTASGCTASASAVVTAPAPPTVTAIGTTLSCTISSGTITATANPGNASYSWSGPNFTSNIQNPTVTQPGTYTVTVTALGSGCTATATAVVTANTTPPTVSVSTTTATCTNPTSVATASSTTPGVLYSWVWPNGTASTASIELTQGILYNLIVTNPVNGCTATSTATYQSDLLIPTGIITAGTLNCSTTSTTVSVNSSIQNVTYSWDGPNISGVTNASSITATSPGVYTVTLTNSSNGCTSSVFATVQQNTTPPTVSIAPPAHLNCNTPAITLDASASSQGSNFVYNWTGTGIISGANTLFPVVNAPNSYTLLVTNTTTGCTSSASATVLQDNPVSVAITNTQQVSCFGGANGSATAVPAGGSGVYTYVWSNNATTATNTNLSAGNYVVTVTDNAGCSSTASVQVTQPATAVSVTTTTTPPTGSTNNNGTATATAAGGTAPYTYLWNTSSTTSSIDGLSAGNYTVTVADNNGCTAVQTVSVSAFNCTFTATIASTNVTCNGLANGSATVTLNNQVAPVLYQWSNQSGAPAQTGLAPGIYIVTVTDATNCPIVLTANITEPQALQAGISTTGVSGIGVNDGTATANVSGGTAPYTYLWSNNTTNAANTGLAPGVYTVTVQDANNCTTTQTAFINAFNCAGSSTVDITPATCFGTNNGSAVATFIGGQAPVSYLWNNGTTTANNGSLLAGTYFVTMTDANGCVVADTAVVTQPDALLAEVTTINNVSCTNQQAGSVVISVSGGGTAPYSFTYPGAGQNLLGVGLYTVPVTNTAGCTTSVEFSILAIDTVPPTVTCPPSSARCDDGNVTNFGLPSVLDNCAPNGVQYEIIEGQANGTYFPTGTTLQVYKVTDGSGNTATCSFTITTYPLPDIQLLSVVNDANNAGIGSIDINPVGGTAPFTYNWEKDGVPFATTQDLSNLFSGKYFVTMTDVNGCIVALAPVNIQNIVGTSTAFSTAGIKMWPNPVTSADVLFISTNNIQPARLEILNTSGQTVVYSEQLSTEITLDIQILASGMYFALLTDQDGMRYMGLFVKQ